MVKNDIDHLEPLSDQELAKQSKRLNELRKKFREKNAGVTIHFAGGNVCKIKGITTDQLVNLIEHKLWLEKEIDDPKPNWLQINNGPLIQLKNVDYVEDFY